MKNIPLVLFSVQVLKPQKKKSLAPLTFDFCLSTPIPVSPIPVFTAITYVVAWPQGDQLLGGGPWHKANLPATQWRMNCSEVQLQPLKSGSSLLRSFRAVAPQRAQNFRNSCLSSYSRLRSCLRSHLRSRLRSRRRTCSRTKGERLCCRSAVPTAQQL